ncbi:hypothetical protein ACE1SV_50750 [Streptomyces sp. E-15]
MISSGRVQDSSIGMPSRTLRYSGSERPAWRMNHTGVCGTGSRLHALRKALSYVAGCCVLSFAVTGQVSHDIGDRRRGVSCPARGPGSPYSSPHGCGSRTNVGQR